MHVIDSDPMSASANGWLEDTSKVEKYVMADEDYAKRENTYRYALCLRRLCQACVDLFKYSKFKEERLKVDPEWTLEKEICLRRGIQYVPPPPKPELDDESFAEEAKAVTVGGRCEVQPGAKRGVVRYKSTDGTVLTYYFPAQVCGSLCRPASRLLGGCAV